MRLATFLPPGGAGPLAGEVQGDAVIAFDDGSTVLDRLRSGERTPATGASYPLAEVTLLAPHAPRAIMAIGVNYALHAEEGGVSLPKKPMVFYKGPGSAVPPGGPVRKHAATAKLDYEVELTLVMGPGGAVAGYCVANDVSARDWQTTEGQWARGKGADTFCPFGPWITTADEVADAYALSIRTWVNGELRQDASTSGLVFREDVLVPFIQEAIALEPGDLILTGTPEGVGHVMDPPRYLQPGDVVRMEIEGLGAIEHPIV